MKRKIFSVLFAVVLALFLCLVMTVPAGANGTIHYVADTGSDTTGDGTSGNPWETIGHAISQASPGDTIIVSDGIYDESLVVNTADLTLESVNGRDATTIQNVGNAGGEQTGFLLMAGATNFTLGGSDGHGFTIEGGTNTAPRLIQLNNGPSGVELSYNTFDSSDTNGTISTGINIGAGGATGLTVDNNIFIADENTYQDWPLTSGGPLTNLTVTYNEFTGSGIPGKYGAAIDLNQSNEATALLSVGTITNNTISGFDRGILTGSGGALVENLDISQNDISGCGKGIMLRGTNVDMATVTVTENNIHDNTLYGIENTTSTVVTAESNWWGDASGPTHTSNPSGTGDEVTDNVDFIPWLDAAYPGGLPVYLVYIGTTGYDTIQAAIDAADPGDTIVAKDGTYTEDLKVENKTDITLRSESGKDVTTIELVDDVGIDLGGGADNFTLGGAPNQGFTILSGAGTTFMIQLANAPSGVEISYNEIDTTGNASQGVSVGAAGASDLTISNNTFNSGDAGDGGIWGPEVANVTVFSNTLTGPASGSSGYGVQFSGVTGASFIINNIISDYTGSGAIVISNGGGTSGLTITANTISDCSNGIRFAEYVQGGTTPDDMTIVTVTGNTITDSTDTAIKVGDGPHVLASQFVIDSNNLSGSANFGLNNAHISESVIAENNWWGTANGPTHADNTFNVGAQGDASSDDVDYVPWLDAAYATGVSFAPVKNITDDPDSTFSSIQAAIDAATANDIITAAAGTYTEDLDIDMSLTLVGSGGAEVAKLTGTGMGPVVTIGDYDVTLKGFEIDPGVNGVDIGDISAGNVVTIEDAIIHGNTEDGIEVGTVYGTLNILGSVIADNGQNGVYILAVDEGGIVNVKSNAIGACAWEEDGTSYDFDGNDWDGLCIDGVYDESTVTIGGATEADYNLICDNGGDGGGGIYVNEVLYESTLTIAGNIIGAFAYDGYIFNSNFGDGIYVDYVNYGSTVTIKDNAIAENDSYGVYIYEVGYDGTTETEAEYYALLPTCGANTVTIESNMIGDWDYEGYSFGGNSSDGISIEYANFASELTIRYNHISGNGDDGIDMEYIGQDGEGFYVDAAGDPLTDDPETSNISVNPDYPNYSGPVFLIKSNTITDNASDGIYQSDDWMYGASVTIEDNVISGNWYDGFDGGDGSYYISYYATLTFHGNTITSNGINGGGSGIDYADARFAGSITIEYNLIAGNFGEGIYSSWVYDKSSLTIQGNTIGAGTDAEGNVYAGNTDEGIYLDDVSEYGTAEISRNTINGNDDAGVYVYCVYDYGSVDITRNDILENTSKGITVYAVCLEGSVDIHYNNIVGNEPDKKMGVKYEYGCDVCCSDEMVDASYNWWGDVSGPSRQGPGTGDGVSDYVVFSPWLSSPAFWDVRAELVSGWNTFSTPVTLDSASDELAELGLDMMETAYGFRNGIWVQITDATDKLEPCDAFYVKMTRGITTINLVPSEGYSDPPSKTLKAGWNLVGLANLSDMAAEGALASAYLVSGDLSGYSQVVSPAVNETTWSAVRGPAIDTVLGYEMIPTEGYWVFMTNAGTLAGFTSTPITLY